jgi:uncharacterized protein YxjI
MYLYIRQKVFSLKNKYYITDENDEQRYYIESELLKIPKTLHIYDTQGKELALVQKVMFKLMPRFEIVREGKDSVQIAQKFSLLKPKYLVEGTDWAVEGDFLGHDYTVKDGSKLIASIHKKWMSWGDCFELYIEDNCDTVLALAVILAIDYVMDAQQSSSYSVN